jgi:hypothetical protein
MPKQDRKGKKPKQGQSDYMRGGKGRRDEVGGSGIYPASSTDAPADAEIRSEGDLVRHKGPRQQKPTKQQGFNKANQSSGSE